MSVQDVKRRVISTGNVEIDKKLGGGIPEGSLILIEGSSNAGKSVGIGHSQRGRRETGRVHHCTRTHGNGARRAEVVPPGGDHRP